MLVLMESSRLTLLLVGRIAGSLVLGDRDSRMLVSDKKSMDLSACLMERSRASGSSLSSSCAAGPWTGSAKCEVIGAGAVIRGRVCRGSPV